MRILYDGSIYSLQPTGGITRYFANLVRRLPADFKPTLIVENSLNRNYPQHPNLKLYQWKKYDPDAFSARLSLYYSQAMNHLMKASLGRQRFDLLHPTYYSGLGLNYDRKRCLPMVLTVHDMIDEIFTAEIDPTGKNAADKRAAITKAARIICVSKNTKNDLLERYRISEAKIDVIYEASEIDSTLSHGPEAVPERRYYLYVGSRASYKNFNRLLTAFAKLISTKSEVALCVVGSPFDEAEHRLITELGLNDRIEYSGHITDNHLAKLYRCSIALIYPSLYEGFGLPPLEAMACGTVAVVANSSSLPEVVGNAGILFDPRSVDELVDILRSLPDDQTRREELIEQGQRRAKQFDWDITVAKTIGVYRAAIG